MSWASTPVGRRRFHRSFQPLEGTSRSRTAVENLSYVSGPGDLWVLSPKGQHLGTLKGPEHPHNLAWGGADGRTLYLAAQTGIYRIRLNVPGAGALPKPAAVAKN